jgi:hypothetical protein
MQPTNNQSIYSYVAPGKAETSVNWIAFKKGGNYTLIPEHDLNSAYFNLFRKEGSSG